MQADPHCRNRSEGPTSDEPIPWSTRRASCTTTPPNLLVSMSNGHGSSQILGIPAVSLLSCTLISYCVYHAIFGLPCKRRDRMGQGPWRMGQLGRSTRRQRQHMSCSQSPQIGRIRTNMSHEVGRPTIVPNLVELAQNWADISIKWVGVNF